MNSCEFLTIKEEIKSLKKEIKKTTKKLKKLECKARECYYSNLGKDVDNEILSVPLIHGSLKLNDNDLVLLSPTVPVNDKLCPFPLKFVSETDKLPAKPEDAP